jgi:uncharacterized membrane protein YsdA (DUF1294 family)
MAGETQGAKKIALLKKRGKLMSERIGEIRMVPEVQNDFIMTVIGSPWGWLAIWLILINLVTFFVFGVDKLKAKRKVNHESIRRVPEKTLFLLAAIGGSIGALLGMKVWHHKTLHKSFRFGIPAILILQILIPAGLYLYFNVIR